MAEEYWDLLTAERVPTGRKLARGQPLPGGMGHIVVLGWVVRPDKQFLISRRSPEKTNPPPLGDDRRRQTGGGRQLKGGHPGNRRGAGGGRLS